VVERLVLLASGMGVKLLVGVGVLGVDCWPVKEAVVNKS